MHPWHINTNKHGTQTIKQQIYNNKQHNTKQQITITTHNQERLQHNQSNNKQQLT